jgi:hypothetical protein
VTLAIQIIAVSPVSTKPICRNVLLGHVQQNLQELNVHWELHIHQRELSMHLVVASAGIQGLSKCGEPLSLSFSLSLSLSLYLCLSISLSVLVMKKKKIREIVDVLTSSSQEVR